MLKEYRIIIVGFGNLGSRYLEGLLKSNLNISVDIYDINYAKKNLQEHNDMKVFFHNTFNTLRFNNYDLLINAIETQSKYCFSFPLLYSGLRSQIKNSKTLY